ncbi:MAG: helix-turn-helix domain-containing protein [Candidatus Omnitrophota bacterium]|nr:helix-turn-helix domain-containing protein [Candidatus Omnitrophota bacterium]
MTADIFWDRKTTKKEAQAILNNDSDPRFPEFASLVLSRAGKPREVFDIYMDKITFLKNWRKIKRKMRKDSWNNKRIIFWDEVYDVLSQDVDKSELKEKRKPVSEEAKVIGSIIRAARQKRQLSQKEFAQSADMSQQFVSFLENGYLNISLSTLKKVLDVLGLELSIIQKQKA